MIFILIPTIIKDENLLKKETLKNTVDIYSAITHNLLGKKRLESI